MQLLALLLACHSAAAWQTSDETIRIVGDRRQGLSGSTARNAAAEMINAESFNQPLSDWQVNSVADISYMFWGASAFDQDLGWCVDDDVDDDYDDDSCLNCGPLDLDKAFNGTKCESTSCGVSICNTDAAPARRISVAAAVAALVSVLIA